MNYTTNQIAQMFGIHTNTVRFYEEMGLLPKVERLHNGYRIFDERHVEQIRLIRIAFKDKLIKGNLRKMIVNMLKFAADERFEDAEIEAGLYFLRLVKLKSHAYDTENYIREQGGKQNPAKSRSYSKSEIMEMLDISGEALRHWERSGLIEYPRNESGRIYFTPREYKLLSIISLLREGDYSVEDIADMLEQVGIYHGESTKTDMAIAAKPGENLLEAIDKILETLTEAMENYPKIREILKRRKEQTIQ